MMRHLTVALLLVLPGMLLADDKKADNAGFVKLFDGKTLDGWKVYPDGTGQWKVEDGAIVGSGRASHLFTERSDFTDFHLRAVVSINDGGNSGMYFRTQFGPGFPKGYEAQINSTHRDPIKTGSLYGFGQPNTVREQLIKPDEFFTYEVIARGNHIVIKVNGKTTVDFKDEKNTHTKGHVAFQQHHDGSIVRIKSVEIKELTGDK